MYISIKIVFYDQFTPGAPRTKLEKQIPDGDHIYLLRKKLFLLKYT
jgi:hypothetical protein